MVILILIGLTLGLAVFDLLFKSYVEDYMEMGEERSFLGGKVKLRKVYNKGICFNLLDKWPDVVKGFSAAITMLLTIYQLMTLVLRRHYLKKAGLSMMSAGAWSNTFDRWIRGYVVDYVGFQTKWKKITEITFNLGDFLLLAGGVITVLGSLFHSGKRKH